MDRDEWWPSTMTGSHYFWFDVRKQSTSTISYPWGIIPMYLTESITKNSKYHWKWSNSSKISRHQFETAKCRVRSVENVPMSEICDLLWQDLTSESFLFQFFFRTLGSACFRPVEMRGQCCIMPNSHFVIRRQSTPLVATINAISPPQRASTRQKRTSTLWCDRLRSVLPVQVLSWSFRRSWRTFDLFPRQNLCWCPQTSQLTQWSHRQRHSSGHQLLQLKALEGFLRVWPRSALIWRFGRRIFQSEYCGRQCGRDRQRADALFASMVTPDRAEIERNQCFCAVTWQSIVQWTSPKWPILARGVNSCQHFAENGTPK